MRRIKLIVAYEGTRYCGWQVQPNGETIEGVLNRALSELTGETIAVIGASRTDAGVHALGNVAVFDTESRIPADKFCYALNARLPEDISIQDSCEVAADFHPRKCVSTKIYEYRILNRRFPLPLKRNTYYFYYRPLDVESMKKAAAYLVGEHDFKSFCSIHTQAQTTVRTIYDIDIEQHPINDSSVSGGYYRSGDVRISHQDDHAREYPRDVDGGGTRIVIRISGSGFLYNMVRIIAGTLIEVGCGKYGPERVKEMLEAADRQTAGPTAPPQGLRLVRIIYEEEQGNH
ncbi:MAG: tRNA pseudouridine(38-40) synthase TruA [Lachnospiraceae bacterium]